MAKITVKVPEIKFRKEKMEVPVSRAESVKASLRAQQDRINARLSRRNEEIARQLDKAAEKEAKASGGSRLASLGKAAGATLSRSRKAVEEAPPAPSRNEAIAAAAVRAASASGRRNRLITLGVGAAIGTGVGLLLAPTTGKNTRAVVGQHSGRVARTAGKTTASQAQAVKRQAAARAAAARARMRSRGDSSTDEPETITARVSTALGEDKALTHLPRINVNTEPGGIVYLRGPLPTEQDRERAERIARKQKGVTEVINEIIVAPSDVQSASSGADAVQ